MNNQGYTFPIPIKKSKDEIIAEKDEIIKTLRAEKKAMLRIIKTYIEDIEDIDDINTNKTENIGKDIGNWKGQVYENKIGESIYKCES